MRPWVVPASCIGWLMGVGVGSVVQVSGDVLHIALAGAAVVVFGIRRVPVRVRLAALSVLAGGLGVWRANDAVTEDAAQRAAWLSVYGRPAIVRGFIEEVVPRGASIRVTVGQLMMEDRCLPGFLRTTVLRLPDAGENTRILLRGTLQRPGELRPQGTEMRGDPTPGVSPRYGENLERIFDRHQVFGVMRFPTVVVVEPGTPSLLTRLRSRLRDVLLRALPEPAAGLYSAFLLSFDQDLDRSLRDQAAATGILHLVAISGSHIAVITGFVFWLSTALGLSRRAATAATLLLTTLFLALTGFPESGVRSALMAGLVLLAYLSGRPAAGLRVLSLAAAAMTLWDPRVLLGDIGFQLSVLAVWGLLALYPILRHGCRHMPDPLRLRTLLLLTVSAELATLPVVAYAFSRVPIIGPLTNLLAAPLFPILLALGGVVLLAGLLVPLLLPFIVPLAAGAGNLFLGIAEIGSSVPGHLVVVPSISLGTFLAGTVALIVAVMSTYGYLPPSARASW